MTSPAVTAIAARLHDLASTMRGEADDATDALRDVAVRAQEIADIAARVDAAAGAVEEIVARQHELLRSADAIGNEGLPMIEALVDSARGIADLATLVASIAGRSRVLALNARIEAARVDATGSGFGAVASEMTALARQSWSASRDIEERSSAIGDGVTRTQAIFATGVAIIAEKVALSGEIAATARTQRVEAGLVADLAGETAERVDAAAAQIGRVASAAMTIDVIARQLVRTPLPAAA